MNKESIHIKEVMKGFSYLLSNLPRKQFWVLAKQFPGRRVAFITSLIT